MFSFSINIFQHRYPFGFLDNQQLGMYEIAALNASGYLPSSLNASPSSARMA